MTTVSRYDPVRFGLTYGEQLDRAGNIQVILYADVSAVLMKDTASDHVDSVLVKTIAGNQFHVKARYFVIACGGIENARVLLLSNQQRSSGVGNHSDLVGRFFKNTFGTPTVTSSLEPAILGSDITSVNGPMVISGSGSSGAAK